MWTWPRIELFKTQLTILTTEGTSWRSQRWRPRRPRLGFPISGLGVPAMARQLVLSRKDCQLCLEKLDPRQVHILTSVSPRQRVFVPKSLLVSASLLPERNNPRLETQGCNSAARRELTADGPAESARSNRAADRDCLRLGMRCPAYRGFRWEWKNPMSAIRGPGCLAQHLARDWGERQP